jgi:MFS family permease
VGDGAYRWLMVVAIAVMVNVGYGTIFYSFTVLLGEGAAASEFSRTLLSAALGLGVAVSGAVALPIGTVCDVFGPRRVFLAGAVLGALGLTAFSQAAASWQVVAAWTFILGPAMACSFYEPAYVAIDQWFEDQQGRAIGLLTVIAGLSSTVFIPLTQVLVTAVGWRGAVLTLAAVQLAVAGPLSLLVRDRPRTGREAGKHVASSVRSAWAAMALAGRRADRTFWLITAAFFLALVATWAMLFHQVAYLQELGFPAGLVAAAVGVAGAISLPARFLIPALGDRIRPEPLSCCVLVALALAGVSLIGADTWWRVCLYVGFFGTVFGSVLPMRAVVMARHFTGELYGRLMGLQAIFLALAHAAGPPLASLLRDARGSYAAAWLAACVLLLAATPVMLAAGRKGAAER